MPCAYEGQDVVDPAYLVCATLLGNDRDVPQGCFAPEPLNQTRPAGLVFDNGTANAWALRSFGPVAFKELDSQWFKVWHLPFAAQEIKEVDVDSSQPS